MGRRTPATTRSAAHEWGRYNINVNIVAPAAASAGYANWKAAHPAVAAEVERSFPLRRIGIPKPTWGP